MNNLTNLINDLTTYDLAMKTKNDVLTWNQTQRNLIRAKLLDSIFADLEASLPDTVDVLRTNDGVTIAIPNDEYGCFFFSLAPKMHDLEYDGYDESDAYWEKQEEKEHKKAARRS